MWDPAASWRCGRVRTLPRAAPIEVLRGIPRNRHVCLGEGARSGWLYEVLEPHVEELVVTGVRKSRGPKSDKDRDAELVGLGARPERAVGEGCGAADPGPEPELQPHAKRIFKGASAS